MIPEKIVIGGHEIIVWEGPYSTENMGTFDAVKNRITLMMSLAESKKEQVLCHEILHFMIYESGLNDVFDIVGDTNYDKFETFTRVLENIFWRFLKDNTDFFEDKMEKPVSKDFIHQSAKAKELDGIEGEDEMMTLDQARKYIADEM